MAQKLRGGRDVSGQRQNLKRRHSRASARAALHAPAAEEDALDAGEPEQALGEGLGAAEARRGTSAAKTNKQNGPGRAPAHLVIHLMAQSAFFLMAGKVSMAWKSLCFSCGSLM